jgi:VanZ family protein
VWQILAWSGLAAVSAASLLSTPPILDELPNATDKLVHTGMYAALMLLFVRAHPGLPALLLGAGLGVFGAVIELLQGLTPARTASIADGVANCAGISIMLALHAAQARVAPTTQPPRSRP